MAYADYGALLPTEALFTEPGAYAGVLKSEALKKASYLSQMDSFYEELEESKRQFDKQYSLAEQQFTFESGLASEQFAFEKEQAALDREMQEKMFETETELAREQMSLEEALGSQGKLQVYWDDQAGFSEEDDQAGFSEEDEYEMAIDFLKELEESRKPLSTTVYGSTPASEQPTEIRFDTYDYDQEEPELYSEIFKM